MHNFAKADRALAKVILEAHKRDEDKRNCRRSMRSTPEQRDPYYRTDEQIAAARESERRRYPD